LGVKGCNKACFSRLERRLQRFLYTPTKFIDEELDDLMQKKGFVHLEDKYESKYLVAIPYKDGLVYAPRSCRWNYGEGVN
jgi:hypothetical protein